MSLSCDLYFLRLQKLSENKLKSLFTELQFQDKEELKLKRLMADGLDKEGLREAEVRRKFKGFQYYSKLDI